LNDSADRDELFRRFVKACNYVKGSIDSSYGPVLKERPEDAVIGF
jgi:hypothetical protein